MYIYLLGQETDVDKSKYPKGQGHPNKGLLILFPVGQLRQLLSFISHVRHLD
jgi:hypothetical protein